MTSPSEWVKFFEEAGIPHSVATKYAVTFAENRISMDLLGDINKEYLRDMNITVTGDIILILKHAKTIQGRLATDKALKGDKKEPEGPTRSVQLQVSSISKPSLARPLTSVAAKPLTTVKPSTSLSAKQQSSTDPKPTASTTSKLASVKSNVVSNATVKSITKTGAPKPAASQSNESVIASRLGPPLTKSFQPKSPIVDEKRGVFDRLGSSPSETTDGPTKSAFSRLGSQSDATEIADYSQTQIVKGMTYMRSSEESTVQASSMLQQKRKSDANIDRRVNERDDSPDSNEPPAKNPKIKKKRFILIRTLHDGTTRREIISPDNPILKKVNVKKTTIPVKSMMSADNLKYKNLTITKNICASNSQQVTPQKSNFRADSMEKGRTIPVKNRVNLQPSSEPTTMSRIAPTSGIHKRLSAKSDFSESEKQKKILKRISPPRSSNLKATVDVKNRISNVHIQDDDKFDLKTERSPQRKRITGPFSTKGNIHDRLG